MQREAGGGHDAGSCVSQEDNGDMVERGFADGAAVHSEPANSVGSLANDGE